MNIQDIRQLALAIAKANGHPEPEYWADEVAKQYDPSLFTATQQVDPVQAQS